MAPSRCLNSPRKRQSERPNSRLPYKRNSPSSYPPLTRCSRKLGLDMTVGLESSLVPPVALLPPIASLTARILGIIDHHHGEMGSFADTFKGIVLESHKDLDQYIRQEIGTRNSQIKEERGRVEKNTKLAKEQDVQMHELKLHFEEKENALRRKLENCQTHLGTSTPNPEIKGVECIADAQGVIAPPSYHLQWPVRTSWSVRSR
ncbi:hypothetical protein C8R41DRAFT_918573 [Lentinula lateritia]|uniref:Uncharacterized protein n=1 Tax=Lentinula lateritia TaxID=40482 RepID=A0ABQ8VJD5_9AGAR|nr:hypothetical protein C8R41DRAFT_918573 [Lentinula lateritia]